MFWKQSENQFQNWILKVRNRILVVKLKFQFHLSIPVCASFIFRWKKGAVKNVFVFESFIQDIHSKTLIHPVMKRVNLE